jgi:hypothetical protein
LFGKTVLIAGLGPGHGRGISLHVKGFSPARCSFTCHQA